MYYIYSNKILGIFKEECEASGYDIGSGLKKELGKKGLWTHIIGYMNDRGCSFAEIAQWIRENINE